MKKYILGNWKQNGDLALVQQMIDALKKLPKQTDQVLAFFPPDVYLSAAQNLLHSDDAIKLGGQNLSAYTDGAYTGEISGAMLKQVGAYFVLVGHSERRQWFGETNVMVAQKFKHALAAGLIPVLCVGESLAEYEAGQTSQVIQNQLQAVLDQDSLSSKEFIIAYEPIWAIGTGKVATPEQAQQVHIWIRQFLSKLCSQSHAEKIPLLYGGSVKPENAAALLQMPDIDGVLVGGASLDAEGFAAIALARI